MNEPKRIEGEKYKRMVALSEKIKDTRPAEGVIINKLILHIDELYEYIDYLRQGECALDDDALERLGVPEARSIPSSPARTGTRRRRRNTHNPRRGYSGDDFQALPTNLEWMNDTDPPF
jgi:hypothetical protein